MQKNIDKVQVMQKRLIEDHDENFMILKTDLYENDPGQPLLVWAFKRDLNSF